MQPDLLFGVSAPNKRHSRRSEMTGGCNVYGGAAQGGNPLRHRNLDKGVVGAELIQIKCIGNICGCEIAVHFHIGFAAADGAVCMNDHIGKLVVADHILPCFCGVRVGIHSPR